MLKPTTARQMPTTLVSAAPFTGHVFSHGQWSTF
jgi:hypothetical protein